MESEKTEIWDGFDDLFGSPAKKKSKHDYWKPHENQAYSQFLNENLEIFANENARRRSRAFKKMSEYLLTRGIVKSSEQCRGHHKKLIERYKTIDRVNKILSARKGQFDKLKEHELSIKAPKKEKQSDFNFHEFFDDPSNKKVIENNSSTSGDTSGFIHFLITTEQTLTHLYLAIYLVNYDFKNKQANKILIINNESIVSQQKCFRSFLQHLIQMKGQDITWSGNIKLFQNEVERRKAITMKKRISLSIFASTNVQVQLL